MTIRLSSAAGSRRVGGERVEVVNVHQRAKPLRERAVNQGIHLEREGLGNREIRRRTGVIIPSDSRNGLGIIDVVSGAYRSDRGKIRDHAMAQLYTILCSHGYTVFAVRPGLI